MQLYKEQSRALAYARRKGSEAPLASIRDKVEATFHQLETLLGSIPAALAGQRPDPSSWSIHEIVDHLVVSHRLAAEELASLVASVSPESGPIPAGLVSKEPFSTAWPDLIESLKTVHRDFLAALARADDDTPLTARAPVLMVVKCAVADGRVEPVEWIESFDFKAYAVLFRAHTLEHLQQAGRTLGAVEPSRT